MKPSLVDVHLTELTPYRTYIIDLCYNLLQSLFLQREHRAIYLNISKYTWKYSI